MDPVQLRAGVCKGLRGLLLFGGTWLFDGNAPGLQAQDAAAQGHSQAAHRYLAEKNPEMAVPEFQAVLASDPGNLDAQANLGVLLYFRGDYAGAEPYLNAAVAQKADLSKIRALLGLAEKNLGKLKEARADLEVAVPQLAEPPIRVQAGLALVELDVAAGEGEKAAGVIAGMRRISPTDPRVLYAAYRIHADLAGEALLSLSLAAPESAQMHQATAHELQKARDSASAITNFRKAAAIDTKLPGIHYELAEALRAAEDPKLRAEADGEYRRAVEQDRKDARSMAALGDLTTDAGDLKGARTWYENALATDPNLAEASIGLAHVLTETGDEVGAAPLLERVVTADPTNTMAHFRLSAVYRKLGRLEEAKRELTEYQRYRAIKERMRTIYKSMREEAPSEDAGAKTKAR